MLLTAVWLVGCRPTASDLTALRVVTSWDATALNITQLEFLVTREGVTGPSLIVELTRRPDVPARVLASGVDVFIYLSHDDAGKPITCEVWGLLNGQRVAFGSVRETVARKSTSDLRVELQPGGTKVKGYDCSSNAECNTGSCVDGVCCDTACTDTCHACNVPGKQRGTCSPLPSGGKDPACADLGPGVCKTDGTCNGAGKCRKYPKATPCTPGVCMGSTIVSAGQCDGDGACVAGDARVCAPFVCETQNGMARCRTTCSSNADCIAGRACDEASCGKRINGGTCLANAECESGFCVDGTCCETKCDGACVSCTQEGATGACRPIEAGRVRAPGLCPDQGPNSCGQNGVCDGEGSCAYYQAGTTCGANACARSTVLVTAGKCNGKGTCQPGGEVPCSPYVCANGACKSTCASNDDCAPDKFCNDRSCGKRGNGQTCNAATDCDSGFCSDGVCCNESCSGACRSCLAGRIPGICTFLTTGSADIRQVCKAGPVSECGRDGTCDGSGGCRRHVAGTVCRDATCSGSTRTLASTCDGQGMCKSNGTSSCGKYVCNGTTCFMACGTDSHCAAPSTCNGGICGLRGTGGTCSNSTQCTAPLVCAGGTCQLKPQGWSCGANSECGSGFCTEGVCCEAANCGTCKSCKISGNLGSCVPIAAGTRDTRCAIDPVATCDRDGTCDGAGGCRLYGVGTVCEPATCSTRITRLNPKICDGAGACQSNGQENCTPYACDSGTGSCYTTCMDANQCANSAGSMRCKNNACN